MVLFNLPPLLSADDAMAVLPHIDCVLLVVGNGMVTTSEMNESLRYLQSANALGVVLNKAEMPKSNFITKIAPKRQLACSPLIDLHDEIIFSLL